MDSFLQAVSSQSHTSDSADAEAPGTPAGKPPAASVFEIQMALIRAKDMTLEASGKASQAAAGVGFALKRMAEMLQRPEELQEMRQREPQQRCARADRSRRVEEAPLGIRAPPMQ